MSTKKKATKKDQGEKKVTAKNAPKSLQDFMLAQLGGEEAVKTNFARAMLKDLPGKMTIQEAFDKASKEGWGAEFKAMPLSAFRLSRVPAKPRAKRGPRVAYADVLAGVTAYLKKGEAYQAASVAKELGFPAPAVRKAFGELIKSGKVQKSGKARAAVFSLV
jgi:hypothetical protein